MWPFRPSFLTEVFPADDLQRLLDLGGAVGSAVSFVELRGEGELASLAERGAGGRKPDAFCDFFRHGRVSGKPAFDGADEACADCEARFARRLLDPHTSAPIVPAPGKAARVRCHMGLTDAAVPISVAGRIVGALIAGRFVEDEDDRLRIRKSAGKLGKLTRKEAENERAVDRLITPADDRARERLLQEIGQVRLGGEGIERELLDLASFIGRIATRQFEAARRAREDAIVESIEAGRAAEPRAFPDLRAQVTVVLDALREHLDVEHLALFAMSPKELDDTAARASLIAESGLGSGAERRYLELDWGRFAGATGVASGAGEEVSRGLGAVSAAGRAIVETRDAPPGLKDAVLKSSFAALVEVGSHLKAAVFFGKPRSSTPADSGDYHFLARLGRLVARRYYALAAELERAWLARELSTTRAARTESDKARRELERTEGFAYFDVRRLLDQTLERAKANAEARGVELNTRELLEHVGLRGDRQALGRVFRRLLEEGVQRTLVDPATGKGPPLRVFLKRGRDKLYFGVEPITELLHGSLRRELLERPGGERPGGDRPGREPAEGGASEGGLAEVVATLRRHEGRIRIDSERLERWKPEPSRWSARTTFLVELPLPAGKREREAESQGERARDGGGSRFASQDGGGGGEPGGEGRRPARPSRRRGRQRGGAGTSGASGQPEAAPSLPQSDPSSPSTSADATAEPEAAPPMEPTGESAAIPGSAT